MIKLEKTEIDKIRNSEKDLKICMGKENESNLIAFQMLTELISKAMYSEEKEDKVIGAVAVSEISNAVKEICSDIALYERAIYRLLMIENKGNDKLIKQFEKCLIKEAGVLQSIKDGEDIEWIDREDKKSEKLYEEYMDKKASLEAEQIRSTFKVV